MEDGDCALYDIVSLIDFKVKGVAEGSVIRLSENHPIMLKWQSRLEDTFIRLDQVFQVFYPNSSYLADTYPKYSEVGHYFEMNVDEAMLKHVFAYINEVRQKEIEKDKIIIVGNVKIDLVRGLLKIGNVEKPVSQMEQKIRFMTLLLAKEGKVQSYIDIAKYVGIVGTDDNKLDGDSDVERNVQSVRNKLGNYLIDKVGFPKNLVEALIARIETSSGLGYVYRLD